MNYFDRFHTLRAQINFSDDVITTGDLVIRNYTFESEAHDILIGHRHYSCDLHGLEFDEPGLVSSEAGDTDAVAETLDSFIDENHYFRYHIFYPPGKGKARKLVFLFHGFNEKTWDKYYSWAMKIVEDTGKAVVLFPISFHMNRARASWADHRLMYMLSESRKKKFPNILKSSLSNAAISARLHSHPQRFIWSGLQTYYDIIRFVETCVAGAHPDIEKDCAFDFFSYSIGSLLAEILKLTDHKGYFTSSKLCTFCGGAVFNRLSPVSKFILDSETNVALYSYLVEHIDNHMKHDPRLRHLLSPGHSEGFNLYSMLDYKVNLEYREEKFRKIQDQVLAITLKKDKVVPAYEVINTLKGFQRDIGIPVDILDFPYPYIHEDPFPVTNPPNEQVNQAFEQVFDRICGFLR